MTLVERAGVVLSEDLRRSKLQYKMAGGIVPALLPFCNQSWVNNFLLYAVVVHFPRDELPFVVKLINVPVKKGGRKEGRCFGFPDVRSLVLIIIYIYILLKKGRNKQEGKKNR